MAYFLQYDLSAKLTSLFIYSCHQQPDRSFWLLGYPIALCCRCLGFYLGVGVSAIAALFNKLHISPKFLIILFALTATDIFINFILHINTGNITRFITGITMGLLFTEVLNHITEGRLKMRMKKIIASILLLLFGVTYSSTALAQGDMTLYEFLNTTDEIKASYEYPSMKIAATGTAEKSLLKAHTPIIIKCAETITTKDIVSGGEVKFVIPSNVTSTDGKILIAAGTPVTAQISFAQDKGFIGKSGELTVTDFHTTAVDGTYIPLSGSISAKPDDKMTVSIVLSVLVCPLFLLMKGKEAQLTIGATKTAYTVSDIYINTTKL